QSQSPCLPLATYFPQTSRSTASSGSINWVQACGKWRTTGAGCGLLPSSTSHSRGFPRFSSSGARPMVSRKSPGLIAFGLVVLALGMGGSILWRHEAAAPIIGIVRATEVRVAPEVGGQLAAIKVEKGARVRAGEIVAELSALELTASVTQARA